MEINFTLNGKPINIDFPAYKRVSEVLREECNIFSVKEGCSKGRCGLCLILLDKRVVYSCMIPLFMIKNKEITTIEGLTKTKEFSAVEEGFKQGGVHLCDYCAPSRTLLTLGVLQNLKKRPETKEIEEIIKGVNCSCTPYETLQSGILLASMNLLRLGKS